MDAISVMQSQEQQRGGNGEHGREREVHRAIQSLLLSSFDTMNRMLGKTWTSERQGNGQPAFESKPAAKSASQEKASTSALPSVFSLLRSLSKSCPVFLLQLPSRQGVDPREDPLFARAIDAAVASLLVPEEALSLGSLELLVSLIQLSESDAESVRNVAGDILSRVRFDVIMSLVVGSCGRLNTSALDHTSELLKRLLMMKGTSTEELRSALMRALSEESVHLGDRGKEVALESFLRSCENTVSEADFFTLVHDLWCIHQVETPESLPTSDQVARFCRKYSTS